MLKGLCRVRKVSLSTRVRSGRTAAPSCQQQGADVSLTSALGVCVVQGWNGIRSVDISRKSPAGPGKEEVEAQSAPGSRGDPAPHAGLLRRAEKAEVPWCVSLVAEEVGMSLSSTAHPISWTGRMRWRLPTAGLGPRHPHQWLIWCSCATAGPGTVNIQG